MRKSRWVILTLIVALAVAFSGLVPASAASTDKQLSSNFTLVNLDTGSNGYTISYVKPDGTEWRTAETGSLAALGDQVIKRQYDDGSLSAGRGSVVVTSDGPLGAVVQVQARAPQVPTYGAYSGVSDGASSVGVPLVIRQRSTASGLANSQIIVQNASSTAVNIEISLIDGNTGAETFKKTGVTIQPSAAFEYDLDTETNLPAGWFGSAVVNSTTAGGEIAVVSNFFTGSDAMQTFNGFPQSSVSTASADAAETWYAPLFTSRLANGLSTPIAVQNVSGGSMAIGTINLVCQQGAGSPAPATISKSNTSAVANTASYYFNPVTDTSFPDGWYGSCIVTTTGNPTNMFVQMRYVNPANATDPAFQNAAAYEGISAGDDIVVVPLYAKRLANGFATAITIQNLSSSQAASVKLEYKAGAGTAGTGCTQTFDNVAIPAGGGLIENLRIEGGTNSRPQIGNDCFGTLTVTSKNGQPIAAFVQLTFLASINSAFATGDSFMAHNAFTISN